MPAAHPSPLLFIRRRWSPTGGAENYLLRLAEHLTAAGTSCRLLCEHWETPHHPFDTLTTLPTRSPQTFAAAANRHLESLDPTLVFSLERGIRAHVYRAGDGLHAAWLDRRARAHPLLGPLRNALNPKNRALLRLERDTFDPARTGHLIANSEMVRGEIAARFPEFPDHRLHVIPNGVDADHFSNGDRAAGRRALRAQDQELIVLLVGAGTQRKGHAAARRAVSRAGAPFRLVIIDRPPASPLRDLYAAADVFLLPTLYDPFANVTLEAMAAALPVLTTRANGASMMIRPGENGFLVDDPADGSTLAALLDQLRDPDLRHRLGTAAQATARACTWEQHLHATLHVLTLANPSASSQLGTQN